MDVVIRTPHVEAEVSVVRAGVAVTLATLVEHVTGRPAPPVVDVDGLATPSSTRLADVDLYVGSVVEVQPEVRDAVPVSGATPAGLELVQLAGPGTTARAALTPGTYRLGPGRRLQAPELQPAPVDTPLLTVRVDPPGTRAPGTPPRIDGVTVELADSVAPGRARLDGAPLRPEVPVPWTSEVLEVDDRAFALRPATRRVPRRPAGRRASDGTIAFERTAGEERWRRRATDPEAFRLGVGLSGGGPSAPGEVTVDLAVERGIGVAGPAHMARAAARAMVVAAARRLGPADLDVVVLTHPGRLATWEWVKWLPHVRIAPPFGPIAAPEQARSWLRSLTAPQASPPWSPNRAHLSLVVVDDERWWRGRAAPLRPLLADPSVPVRWLVVGESATDLPAVCGTILADRHGDGASLVSADGHERIERFVPYLLAERDAVAIARELAPLDDQDVEPTSAAGGDDPLTLYDLLVGEGRWIDAVDVADRWAAPAPASPTVSLVLGATSTGPCRVPLGDERDAHVLLAGPAPEVVDVARAVVTAAAVEQPPERLVVVLVDELDGSGFGRCTELPHVAGLATDVDAAALGRVVADVSAEIDRRRAATPSTPLPALLVVVHAGLEGGVLGDVLDELSLIAVSGPPVGVHLLIAADVPADRDEPVVVDPRLAAFAATRLALGVRHPAESEALLGAPDAARLPRHHAGAAVVRRADGSLAPVTTVIAATRDDELVVRPFVVGRDHNALERRLVHVARAPRERSADDHLDALVDVVRAVADRQARPRPSVLREPLPHEVAISELLARHPGDAVPFALVDRPGEPQRRVAWWHPGIDAPLVLDGRDADRDAVTDVIVALVVGLAARCSADDVHVYVVHAGGTRLDELRSLPHVGAVVAARSDTGSSGPAALAGLAVLLASEAERRRELLAAHGRDAAMRTWPSIVVVVDGADTLHAVVEGTRVEHVLADLVPAGHEVGIGAIVSIRSDAAAIWLPVTEGPRWHLAIDGRRATSPDGVDARIARPPADLAGAAHELGVEPARVRPPAIPPAASGGATSDETA